MVSFLPQGAIGATASASPSAENRCRDAESFSLIYPRWSLFPSLTTTPKRQDALSPLRVAGIYNVPSFSKVNATGVQIRVVSAKQNNIRELSLHEG